MQIIILTLLFGLLGYTTSKPLESNDATDALVDLRNWPATALQTWPLQPAPLTAYSTYGLNLLIPAQLESTMATLKTQAQTQSSKNTFTTLAPSAPPQFSQPQYLNSQQYFVLSHTFYNAPFAQYAYATGQQFLPQIIQTVPSNVISENTMKTTTTTPKPKVKDTEPTTKKPQGSLKIKPPKLQLNPQTNNDVVGDFKSDVPLLRAVKTINPEFVIEEIMPIPGRHILSTTNIEKVVLSSKIQKNNSNNRPLVQITPNQPQKLTNKKALQRMNSNVKVEATGKTSTTGTIPQIPFGTYFLPYFSQGQLQKKPGTKTAALILEPHSKAIVGNGGTAISTPISKAYLKRGVATNVYFNPESVAIAGVGGKAHAQADLELDLIN